MPEIKLLKLLYDLPVLPDFSKLSCLRGDRVPVLLLHFKLFSHQNVQRNAPAKHHVFHQRDRRETVFAVNDLKFAVFDGRLV